MKFCFKKLNWFIPSLMFFVVIVFPFFTNVFISQETLNNAENRKLAPFPEKISTEFPKEFDKFYQDHLPWRTEIVSQYSKFRRDIFKVNEKVLFGEKDWLFYNSDGDGDTIADFSGTNLFSQEELDGFLKKALSTKEQLSKNGAKVLITIAPNKSQVYSELMPNIYRDQHSNVARRNQVEEALGKNGIEVVSLKRALVDAKALGETYFRTDTHWNSLGANAGFKEIVKRIEGEERFLSLFARKTEKWVVRKARCGDIYKNMLGLKESCDDLDLIDENNEFDVNSLSCETGFRGEDKILKKCLNKNSLSSKTVLIIGDSFSDRLTQNFSSLYRQVFAMDRVNDRLRIKQIIDYVKPDIVVVEVVERYIPFAFSFLDCEKK